MWPIFKNKILIFQLRANKAGKNLFGKIIHHLDQEIRKMLVRDMFWNKNSTFHFVYDLLAIEFQILLLKLTMALNLNFNFT